MKKVAVIGAGSWGTALAIVLADNENDVRLWARRQNQVDEINSEHTNGKYLPEIQLPENIVATTDLKDAVIDTDTIVLVTPTKAMREILQQLKGILEEPVTIVHASKGIEPDTLLRVSEVIE